MEIWRGGKMEMRVLVVCVSSFLFGLDRKCVHRMIGSSCRLWHLGQDEQKSLQMQPLKKLPELVPSQTLTSPALFSSPFSPTFLAPPSEQRQPWASNGRMQETCFTWESLKKEKDLPAWMTQALMGPEQAGSVTWKWPFRLQPWSWNTAVISCTCSNNTLCRSAGAGRFCASKWVPHLRTDALAIRCQLQAVPPALTLGPEWKVQPTLGTLRGSWKERQRKRWLTKTWCFKLPDKNNVGHFCSFHGSKQVTWWHLGMCNFFP